MLNRKIRATVIAFNIIFVAVLIILSPLAMYLFNMGQYFSLYEQHQVTQSISEQDLTKITGNLINFFRNREEIIPFEPEGPAPAFTDNEISHLEDVRVLTDRLLIIFYSSLGLFVLSSILLVSKKIALFFKSMGLVFVGSAGLVGAILVLLYLFSQNFWVFFEQFHQVFFPQGNYMFPADSLLITLFPLGFFHQFFLKMVMTSGIVLAIVLLLGFLFLYANKLQLRKQDGRNQ